VTGNGPQPLSRLSQDRKKHIILSGMEIVIGVIGAGDAGEEEYITAFEAGREIARRKCTLICGGMGGVMEAACKTLVTQRLKCSGMAWTPAGGQAILTLRSLIQSARWSRAWNLLAADFRQTMTVLASPRYNALPLAA